MFVMLEISSRFNCITIYMYCLEAVGRPILAAAAYQAAGPARKRVRRQDCLPHLDAHALYPQGRAIVIKH